MEIFDSEKYVNDIMKRIFCSPCNSAIMETLYSKVQFIVFCKHRIPGSPEQPKWISCGLFCGSKYMMKKTHWCRFVFFTNAVAPAGSIRKGAGCQVCQPAVQYGTL
jgi:hypothetical protein